MVSGDAPDRDDAGAAAAALPDAAAESPATLPFELSRLEQPSAAEIATGTRVARMSRVDRIRIRSSV
jgi:hypothetical protein